MENFGLFYLIFCAVVAIVNPFTANWRKFGNYFVRLMICIAGTSIFYGLLWLSNMMLQVEIKENEERVHA